MSAEILMSPSKVLVPLLLITACTGLDDPGNQPALRDPFDAVFYYNIDDDDQDGVADCEDHLVNGPRDELDLCLVSLPGFRGSAERGLEVRVHIEPPAAQDAIRVFWKTDGRWQEVHSCGPDFTLPIESSVPGMEFGVEGRKRVSRSWDGYVQLELDLVNGAGGDS